MKPWAIAITFGLFAASCLPQSAMAKPNVFVEASITPNEVFVNAQATYSLRLYQAVDVKQIKFEEPRARLAEIREITAGKSKNASSVDVSDTTVERDGKRYRVLERRYALLPFASGNLTLTEGKVSGKTPTGKKLLFNAPPVSLNVLPAPLPPVGATWLPASRLELTEIEASQKTHDIGQTITRTLRIEAVGVDASALPELAPTVSGAYLLAMPPTLSNHFKGDQNVGVREQRFELIPTQSGQLELPAIQIAWWDVNLRRWNHTELSGKKIEILGEIPTRNVEPTQGDLQTLLGKSRPPDRYLWATALALLLLLLLITINRRRSPRNDSAQPSWLTYRIARHRIFKACRRNDAISTHRALLAWGKLRWPDSPPMSLGKIIDRQPDLRASISELEARLYSNRNTIWQGKSLAKSLNRT